MPENAFIILGVSSGIPQPGYACSGYTIKSGGELSLVDCGGGVSSSFLRRGLDPLAVKRIFISHTHPDHVSDLPLFIQMIYLYGRKEPLDVYLPEEFVQPFKIYLNAVYLLTEKLPFKLNLYGYQDGFIFRDRFTLKAIGNRHLSGYAPFLERLNLSNRMQCHSFALELAGKSLLYSADIYDLDDIKEYFDGHDYVVIEPTHLDFEQFLKFIREVKVGQYIITHLGRPEEIAALARQVAAAGVENLVMAKEGMEIDFSQ
ncbi:MAG: MBL fold metallo-hydrolase [Candidatus Zixiibacteriota bacterium]